MEFIKQLQLEKDIIGQLTKYAILKTYSKGDQIIPQNTYKDQISFIESGLIKVYIEGENSSLFLYHLEPEQNNILSLMNTFNNSPSQVAMMALQETSLFWIPNIIIRELVKKSPKLKSAIFQSNDHVHNNLIKLIEKITLYSVEDRIYDYLKTKLKFLKTQTIKITHEQIAVDLNFSRETISRGLKKLEENKRITLKYGLITIM